MLHEIKIFLFGFWEMLLVSAMFLASITFFPFVFSYLLGKTRKKDLRSRYIEKEIENSFGLMIGIVVWTMALLVTPIVVIGAIFG